MGTKKNAARILIVDDHPLLRQGIAELINNEPDLEVCGEAEDPHKAIDQVEKLQPDIIVLDISLKGASGIELLKNSRFVIHGFLC